MTPRYIHIEGLDLSGKTSVSKAIASSEENSWAIRSASISQKTNPIRELTDRLCEEGMLKGDTIGLAYAAALKADIDTFVPPENDTIQESTILLRSLAYHAVKGNQEVLRIFEEIAPSHPKFDRSYMLTASREVRLARLALRPNNTEHDLLIVREPKQFSLMEDAIIDYAQDLFDTEVIDTSSQSIDEVAGYITNSIGGAPDVS